MYPHSINNCGTSKAGMQIVVAIGVFLLRLFLFICHYFVSIASDGIEHQLVVGVQLIVVAEESELRISRLLGFEQNFHLTALLRDEESCFFNDGMLLHVGRLQKTSLLFFIRTNHQSFDIPEPC
jgi:hypothetical protein